MVNPFNPQADYRDRLDWSMWDTNTYQYRHAAGLPEPKKTNWKKWPNPLSFIAKDVQVLACEFTFQAQVTFYSATMFNFVWSNFIPSPIEQTRHFFLGQYKCRWLFRPKVKSPFDYIFSEARVSRVLLEIAGPITTGLFWWWATETTFAALDQAQTLLYRQDMCEAEHKECLIRDGNGALPGVPGHRIGSPGLYQVIYDPGNRYPFGGSHIDILEPANIRASAFGRFDPKGCSFHNITVWVSISGQTPIKESFPDVTNGIQTEWSVSWQGPVDICQVSITFEMDVEGASVLIPTVWSDRFTVKQVTYDPTETPHTMWDNKEPENNCDKLWAQLYGENE